MNSLCDWGQARNYAEIHLRIFQEEVPQVDFVIATVRQESHRRLIERVATEFGWGDI